MRGSFDSSFEKRVDINHVRSCPQTQRKLSLFQSPEIYAQKYSISVAKAAVLSSTMLQQQQSQQPMRKVSQQRPQSIFFFNMKFKANFTKKILKLE